MGRTTPAWRYRPECNISSGLLADGRSVFCFQDGGRKVVSIDQKRGTVRWEYSHASDFHYLKTVASNTLLIECLTEISNYKRLGKSDLVGLDNRTGDLKFSIEIPRVHESVAEWGTEFWLRGGVTLHDEKVFFGTSDGFLYVFDADTGREIARREFEAAPEDGPFIHQQNYYWILENGQIVRYNKQENKFRAMYRPSRRLTRNAMLTSAGNLLYGHNSGDFKLVSLATGETLWTLETKAVPGNVLLIEGDTAYVTVSLQLWRISLKEGKLLDRAPAKAIFSQLIRIDEDRFLPSTPICFAIVDNQLQPRTKVFPKMGLKVIVQGGRIFYVAGGVSAVEISSLER
ncbi:MAG: PQQ-binding-like beta-propeller repeat protein [Bacteroidota bacterium]